MPFGLGWGWGGTPFKEDESFWGEDLGQFPSFAFLSVPSNYFSKQSSSICFFIPKHEINDAIFKNPSLATEKLVTNARSEEKKMTDMWLEEMARGSRGGGWGSQEGGCSHSPNSSAWKFTSTLRFWGTSN